MKLIEGKAEFTKEDENSIGLTSEISINFISQSVSGCLTVTFKKSPQDVQHKDGHGLDGF